MKKIIQWGYSSDFSIVLPKKRKISQYYLFFTFHFQYLTKYLILVKQITSCKTNHEPKTNSAVHRECCIEWSEFANFDKNSLPWPKGIYKVTLTLQSECES